MKTYITTIIALFCLSLSAQDITPYAEQIKLEQVKEHVYTLASPEMMGRNTGEQGQKDAAKYISNYFRLNGLDSLNMDQYQQHFNMVGYDQGKNKYTYTVYLEEKDTTINVEKEPRCMATGNIDYDTIMPLKYIGYGDSSMTGYLSHVALIMLTDGNMDNTYKNIKRLKNENNASIFFLGSKKGKIFPIIPTLEELENAKNSDVARKALEYTSGKYLEGATSQREILLQSIQNELPQDVIVNYLTKWRLRYLMGTPPKKLLRAEKKRVKGKTHEHYTPLRDTLQYKVSAHAPIKKNIPTENIIAFVEGTDLKHEVIVISGHYDHIGTENDTTINYGADDNASGTTGVMEVAKAFQMAANDGVRARRSVLFVAFTGEEIGLHGSHYFVNNCPVDIDSIVLNINMDMIGRNADNKDKNKNTVYVISQGKHDGFTKRTAKRLGKGNDSLIVSSHPGFSEKLTWSMSSDHFRFSRKGIPIACFFTGLHPDYHTPRDTPDKINYEKLTEICKLCTLTAWDIANSNKNLLSKRKHKDPNFIEKMMD